MTFAETLGVVCDGNKIARFRRPLWPPNAYLSWGVRKNDNHVNPVIYQDDLVADDWEIIDD